MESVTCVCLSSKRILKVFSSNRKLNTDYEFILNPRYTKPSYGFRCMKSDHLRQDGLIMNTELPESYKPGVTYDGSFFTFITRRPVMCSIWNEYYSKETL
jgi:hypothetical protein